MSNPIGWCDATWNPIIGCSKCSPGCDHCYAERMAKRLVAMELKRYKDAGESYLAMNDFRYLNVCDVKTRWSKEGSVWLDLEQIDKPLRWKKPRRVFVGSMGDVFHEKVERDWILSRLTWVFRKCPQHLFMLLTKRAKNMHDIMSRFDAPTFPNVMLGVTVCNQAEADEKLPWLERLSGLGWHTYISMEPMLGSINLWLPLGGNPANQQMPDGFRSWPKDKQDNWIKGIARCTYMTQCISPRLVILGGENGPGARPMHPDWARSIRDQCKAAGVPFWFKGWGEWKADGKPWEDGSLLGGISANQRYMNLEGGHGFHGQEVYRMTRVGRKRTGRLLDGVEYREFPERSEK